MMELIFNKVVSWRTATLLKVGFPTIVNSTKYGKLCSLQNRRKYNQSNKNFHLFSHMAIAAAPLMVQLNLRILFQEVQIGMRNF